MWSIGATRSARAYRRDWARGNRSTWTKGKVFGILPIFFRNVNIQFFILLKHLMNWYVLSQGDRGPPGSPGPAGAPGLGQVGPKVGNIFQTWMLYVEYMYAYHYQYTNTLLNESWDLFADIFRCLDSPVQVCSEVFLWCAGLHWPDWSSWSSRIARRGHTRTKGNRNQQDAVFLETRYSVIDNSEIPKMFNLIKAFYALFCFV